MKVRENSLELCKGTHTKHLRDNPQADKGISTSNSKMSVSITRGYLFCYVYSTFEK